MSGNGEDNFQINPLSRGSRLRFHDFPRGYYSVTVEEYQTIINSWPDGVRRLPLYFIVIA